MIQKIDCLLRTALACSITLYQKLLSPDHSFWARFVRPAGFCQFYPSCSTYAREALSTYTLPKSLVLIFNRLARCHPWSKGGFDFLPHQK